MMLDSSKLFQFIFLSLIISFSVDAFQSQCSSDATFLVGSATKIIWDPKVRGKGLSILTYSKNGLETKYKPIPTSIVDENPSYMTKSYPYVYVVKNSTPNGTLTQLSITNKKPYISNQTISMIHGSTSHVSVIKPRYYNCPTIILTANYGFGTKGSSIVSFIQRNGYVKKASRYTIDPKFASKANPKRQEAPHPHMVLPYRQGTIVPDLGSDIVWYFDINPWTAKIKLLSKLKLKPGDGPRHADYHVNSDTIYIVNELSLTLSVIRRGNCNGSIILHKGNQLYECNRYQLISNQNLPKGETKASAIRSSEDNRFLYISIRFEDKPGIIVVFSKNQKTGQIIKKIGQFSSQGIRPRDFIIVENVIYNKSCISFLAVVNVDSDQVVLIERNQKTGLLANHAFAKETVYDANSIIRL